MDGIKTLGLKAGAMVLAACLSVALLVGCGSQASEKKQADFSGVRSVCELATLEAYYHNVAKTDVGASGPFAELLNTGHKRVWIEYSGTVYFGVDADEVSVGEPNEQGEVEISMPEVKVLDSYLDKESIGTPVVETGFLTNVTAEEKAAGIAAAQDDMVKQAEQDQSLRTQARDKAQRILAAYVQNLGDAIGETYTVRWV